MRHYTVFPGLATYLYENSKKRENTDLARWFFIMIHLYSRTIISPYLYSQFFIARLQSKVSFLQERLIEKSGFSSFRWISGSS